MHQEEEAGRYTPMLELHSVKKTYGGVTAVADVSFRLHTGELVALVGPNGAGKTTLMTLVLGMAIPDSGRVIVGGDEVTGLPASHSRRAVMSCTFQTPRIFFRLTVRDNLRLAALAKGRLTPDRIPNVERWLARLNLSHLGSRPAAELSGGQLRLLEIARALLPEPRLVLMDEPTSGVNPAIQRAITSAIRDAVASTTTFLIISHDLNWVLELFPRVLVMADGKLVYDGSPGGLRENERVIANYLGKRHA